MYKNYIFDLYGTLVDINTDENKVELWEKLSLFYSLKGAIYGAEELKNTYLEKVKNEIELIKDSKYPDFPLEKVFYSLYEDKGITASDEIVEDTAQFFRVLSINYINLYDGVIELLEKLKAKGKKIYLLSNAQRVFTLFEMRMLGIEKYFDDILFSADY
ncbi:HAD family hydrolase, partial [Clostridium saudiense]|nr:HAD family hydrolase [Clostridium saudiense]